MGIFLPKLVPQEVIKTLNSIWKSRKLISPTLIRQLKAVGSEVDLSNGVEAQAKAVPLIQDAAWILYDGGFAKVKPDTLGIAKKLASTR
jgi:hypothetical protein